jgi:ribonucleotide reductase beta subunit family protein with ferritin-like domain
MPSNAQRYVVFPIQENDLWQMYKLQVASFWTPEEIDFSKDIDDWEKQMTEDQRHFVKHILVFFASADTIVSLNLMENFMQEVPYLEAQIAYTFQAAVENVHAEVYSLMMETYIKDPVEKEQLMRDVPVLPAVRRKTEWAKRWAASRPGSSSSVSFCRRLLAFVIVEGLFFSSSFCAIYWLKQMNLLPGLTKSNEFIARDECMHTEFGCLLFCKLCGGADVNQETLHAMLKEAVDIEIDFVRNAISVRLIGMNADLMAQYVCFVADNLCRLLRQPVIYGASNPFAFMTLFGMEARSNFFEERVSLYQKAGLPSAASLDLSVQDF